MSRLAQSALPPSTPQHRRLYVDQCHLTYKGQTEVANVIGLVSHRVLEQWAGGYSLREKLRCMPDAVNSLHGFKTLSGCRSPVGRYQKGETYSPFCRMV